MRRIVSLLGKGIFWFAAALALLWFVIARPIHFSSGSCMLAHPVNPDHLKEHVRRLSEDFVPRDYQHPENMLRAAEYMQQALRPFADKVALQPFSVARHGEYVNVLAEYGPDTEEILVVGAHYDAFSVFPGADDNASGAAGLIELSRLLARLDLRSRVELVAYALEEPPFFGSQDMGSAVHARSLKERGKTVSLAIILEMIGFFSDEKGSQSYPAPLLQLYYPDQGNFIAIVDQVFSAKAQDVKSAINLCTDLPAYSINAPAAVPGIDFSDHRNYWSAGFPAVMVTDTAFYRNPAYHSAHDTYDTLNYEKMAQVICGIFKYIEKNYAREPHLQEN
jgi:hypothetical protein